MTIRLNENISKSAFTESVNGCEILVPDSDLEKALIHTLNLYSRLKSPCFIQHWFSDIVIAKCSPVSGPELVECTGSCFYFYGAWVMVFSIGQS